MSQEKINGGVLTRCVTPQRCTCNHPAFDDPAFKEQKIRIGDEWTCGECGQPWRASLDKMAAPNSPNRLYWRRAKPKKQAITTPEQLPKFDGLKDHPYGPGTGVHVDKIPVKPGPK